MADSQPQTITPEQAYEIIRLLESIDKTVNQIATRLERIQEEGLSKHKGQD